MFVSCFNFFYSYFVYLHFFSIFMHIFISLVFIFFFKKNALCVVSALPLLPSQKQTHPKKHYCCHKTNPSNKNGPAGRRDGLRVAVNRRMTGWMKCPSGWMDRGTTLGEASFNIPSTETVRPTEASFHPLSGFRGSRPNAGIQGKLHLVGFTLALLYVICNDVQFGIVPPRNAQVVDSRAMATRAMAVNLVVHSWMPSCPGLNWQKFFSGPLHWWDSTRRLEKVGKCNMLMKVCAAFCVLMMPFMPGMWRIHGWSA
jgi:hypothetical protein